MAGGTETGFELALRCPLEKHVSFKPSYIYESIQGLKDIHYLLFGLIFSTKPIFTTNPPGKGGS